MDKVIMAKVNEALKAKGLQELSMDELDKVIGGEITDEQRKEFIKWLICFKQSGLSKGYARSQFNVPELLEIIEEVWNTL